jgi:hypothetical protein
MFCLACFAWHVLLGYAHAGGFQDARASAEGAEFYIENVVGYLDAPNEFYFSKQTKILYMCVILFDLLEF